jgi:hypothetical protein
MRCPKLFDYDSIRVSVTRSKRSILNWKRPLKPAHFIEYDNLKIPVHAQAYRHTGTYLKTIKHPVDPKDNQAHWFISILSNHLTNTPIIPSSKQIERCQRLLQPLFFFHPYLGYTLRGDLFSIGLPRRQEVCSDETARRKTGLPTSGVWS